MYLVMERPRSGDDFALLWGPSYARDALRVLLNCSGLQQVDLSLKRKNFWKQASQVLFNLHGTYLVAK